MKYIELIQRIDALEKRVADLEKKLKLSEKKPVKKTNKKR